MPRQKASNDAATESYELLMQRLQDVVERLEVGELPLADALGLYEEGVKLAARCQALLDAAELRVQQLVAGSDGVETMPWSEG